MSFKNLAGDPNADQQILYELKFADIPIIEVEKTNTGVSTKYMGYWGIKIDFFNKNEIPKLYDFFQFTFRRAWYYYVVSGLVPLSVAEKMNKVMKNEIRICGYVGGTDIEPCFISWYDGRGKRLGLKSELEKLSSKIKQKILNNNYTRYVDNYENYGNPYIDLYHIDTQEGLNYFFKTLKKELHVDEY